VTSTLKLTLSLIQVTLTVGLLDNPKEVPDTQHCKMRHEKGIVHWDIHSYDSVYDC